MGRSRDPAFRDVAAQTGARHGAIGSLWRECCRDEGEGHSHPNREVLGGAGKSQYLAAEVGSTSGALHTAGEPATCLAARPSRR